MLSSLENTLKKGLWIPLIHGSKNINKVNLARGCYFVTISNNWSVGVLE